MALRGVVTASNTTAGASPSVNVSTISGFAAGDIILLIAQVDTNPATFTWPSGFSAISGLANMAVTGGGGTDTCSIQYKVATGTETTLTVSVTGSNLYTITARVYSGRSATPFAVTAVSTGPVASAPTPVTLSITGLTANAGDDLVLFVNASSYPATTTWSFTPPTGFGNSRIDNAASTVAYSPAIGSCDKLAVSAGATGTLGGTLSWVGGANNGYSAYLISLAASGGGPSPAPIINGGKVLISNGKVVISMAPLAWIIGRRNALSKK